MADDGETEDEQDAQLDSLLSGIVERFPADRDGAASRAVSGQADSASFTRERGSSNFSFRHQSRAHGEDSEGSEENRAAEMDATGKSFLPVLIAISLFLTGTGLAALSIPGSGTPFQAFATVGVVGLVLSALLLASMMLGCSHLLKILGRILVGVLTLLTALTGVGLLFFETFIEPNVRLGIVDLLPSATLSVAASFVFAASLSLLGERSTPRWILAAFCLICSILVPVSTARYLLGHQQGVFANAGGPLTLNIGLENQWALVDRQPLAVGGETVIYRHRIAPLQATLEPVVKGMIRNASLASVGKRLKNEYEGRSGTFACVLSAVDGKPHQMKLMSFGQQTTAVLIVRTAEGFQTLSVHGKRDVFDRYEADVNRLFSAVK